MHYKNPLYPKDRPDPSPTSNQGSTSLTQLEIDSARAVRLGSNRGRSTQGWKEGETGRLATPGPYPRRRRHLASPQTPRPSEQCTSETAPQAAHHPDKRWRNRCGRQYYWNNPRQHCRSAGSGVGAFQDRPQSSPHSPDTYPSESVRRLTPRPRHAPDMTSCQASQVATTNHSATQEQNSTSDNNKISVINRPTRTGRAGIEPADVD